MASWMVARYPLALRGGVSRPSRKAWTQTSRTFSRAASSRQAARWPMSLCTPPPETSPMRCSRLPLPAALAHAWRKTRFSKKLPSLIARLMRVRSW